MMAPFAFPKPMPFPVHPSAPPEDHAQYRQDCGHPTIDDVWLLRNIEQDAKNKQRKKDWSTKIKYWGWEWAP